MVLFHSYVNVYQRVHTVTIWHHYDIASPCFHLCLERRFFQAKGCRPWRQNGRRVWENHWKMVAEWGKHLAFQK